MVDGDLDGLSRDELVAEVQRLRDAIRAHRDSSGHDLCWYHPELWATLPESSTTEIAVSALAAVHARLCRLSNVA